MEKIKIPVAIQVVVDDVGWYRGWDERYMNAPARSGLPRYHVPEDVRTLNAIGEGINQKIVCSLVLGDWDKERRLLGHAHLTPDPEGWRAECLDRPEYAEEYFKALEESPYLDYAIHGLNHAYYTDGVLENARQYTPSERGADGKLGAPRWLPDGEFREMVRLFIEIYRDWGFKKELKAFVCPCGILAPPEFEGNQRYSRVLREFGVTVWANGWPKMKTTVDVLQGITALKCTDVITWNAYGADPTYIENDTSNAKGEVHMIGFHLTNFIRFNPERNREFVPLWVDYLKRISAPFGRMLARDIDEAASQALYAKYAKIEKTDGGYEIDLTALDALGACAKRPEFFLSLEDGAEPCEVTGGKISPYEKKNGHTVYRIERGEGSLVEIRI